MVTTIGIYCACVVHYIEWYANVSYITIRVTLATYLILNTDLTTIPIATVVIH